MLSSPVSPVKSRTFRKKAVEKPRPLRIKRTSSSNSDNAPSPEKLPTQRFQSYGPRSSLLPLMEPLQNAAANILNDERGLPPHDNLMQPANASKIHRKKAVKPPRPLRTPRTSSSNSDNGPSPEKLPTQRSLSYGPCSSHVPPMKPLQNAAANILNDEQGLPPIDNLTQPADAGMTHRKKAVEPLSPLRTQRSSSSYSDNVPSPENLPTERSTNFEPHWKGPQQVDLKLNQTNKRSSLLPPMEPIQNAAANILNDERGVRPHDNLTQQVDTGRSTPKKTVSENVPTLRRPPGFGFIPEDVPAPVTVKLRSTRRISISPPSGFGVIPEDVPAPVKSRSERKIRISPPPVKESMSATSVINVPPVTFNKLNMDTIKINRVSHRVDTNSEKLNKSEVVRLSIPKAEGGALENPKVVGFVAMVTGCDINRVQDDAVTFDIIGNRLEQDNAVKKILERCYDVPDNCKRRLIEQLIKEGTARGTAAEKSEKMRKSGAAAKDNNACNTATFKTLPSSSKTETRPYVQARGDMTKPSKINSATTTTSKTAAPASGRANHWDPPKSPEIASVEDTQKADSDALVLAIEALELSLKQSLQMYNGIDLTNVQPPPSQQSDCLPPLFSPRQVSPTLLRSPHSEPESPRPVLSPNILGRLKSRGRDMVAKGKPEISPRLNLMSPELPVSPEMIPLDDSDSDFLDENPFPEMNGRSPSTSPAKQLFGWQSMHAKMNRTLIQKQLTPASLGVTFEERRERILLLAHSPLSLHPPPNWCELCDAFKPCLKEKVVERFDPAQHTINQPKCFARFPRVF